MVESLTYMVTQTFPCPRCKAAKGRQCKTVPGGHARDYPHVERMVLRTEDMIRRSTVKLTSLADLRPPGCL